jgi:hypothetical protein
MGVHDVHPLPPAGGSSTREGAGPSGASPRESGTARYATAALSCLRTYDRIGPDLHHGLLVVG